MNLSTLVTHYIKHELPRLAFSTQCAYQSNLKSWIMPKWGNHQLREVKAVLVEAWLFTLPLKSEQFRYAQSSCQRDKHSGTRWLSKLREQHRNFHVGQHGGLLRTLCGLPYMEDRVALGQFPTTSMTEE